MRPIVIKAGSFSAASTTSISAAATPTSGTALTLAGQPDTPRRLLVTPVSQTNAGTLLVTGTNWAGDIISETISVPASSATAIISALDYKSVTSIMPSGGPWTANISIGTSAATTAGSSPWARLDDYGFAPVALQVDVTNGTGSLTYTVETSLDDPNLMLPQTVIAPAGMIWIADPNLTSQSSSKQDAMVARSVWARLTINSYTGTASATLTVSQAGGKDG